MHRANEHYCAIRPPRSIRELLWTVYSAVDSNQVDCERSWEFRLRTYNVVFAKLVIVTFIMGRQIILSDVIGSRNSLLRINCFNEFLYKRRKDRIKLQIT